MAPNYSEDGPIAPPYGGPPNPSFTCGRCRAEHECPGRDRWGVWQWPATLTTSRKRPDEGWAIHCVECSKDSKERLRLEAVVGPLDEDSLYEDRECEPITAERFSSYSDDR